jgi:hypothetical protein
MMAKRTVVMGFGQRPYLVGHCDHRERNERGFCLNCEVCRKCGRPFIEAGFSGLNHLCAECSLYPDGYREYGSGEEA